MNKPIGKDVFGLSDGSAATFSGWYNAGWYNEWLERPVQSQFELEQNRPDLLVRGRGDPYQQLKVDLRGHIHERWQERH